MYNHLQEFIADLYKAGEMITITDPVSAEIEISRYTDKESKSPGGGKALYFTNRQRFFFSRGHQYFRQRPPDLYGNGGQPSG